MPDWRHAIAGRLEPLHLPPTREAEVVEELSQHLDDRYAELRAAGASEDAARRDALSELDDADLARELTGIENGRREPLALGGGSKDSVMSGVWQDVRFGARLLAKEPTSTLVIVVTLALAIAANTIVFGFTDLLILRPLPIGNAARLVTIYSINAQHSQDRQAVSVPDFLDIKAQNASFEDLSAMSREWPVRSPIGDHLTMADQTGRPSGDAIEIVGIVDNVVSTSVDEPAPPRLYRPLARRPLTQVAFVVRGPGDVTLLAPSVREALRTEDRDLAVSDVRSFGEGVKRRLRTQDLIMALFISFAAIGLIVAVTGVYGVAAFTVSQRRHEIGVRLALGATVAGVVRLIMGRSFRLIGIGVVLGLLGGWTIGLTMGSLLFGVGAADPLTSMAVLAVVTAGGFLATYLPAHRVASIDPATVLKRE